MKMRVLLIGLLLVASTTSALAAGPYIGAAGGFSVVHDGDIDAPGLASADAEYDTGGAFSISAGYNFEPVRLEFEFGYMLADVNEISGPGGSFSVSNSDVTVMSFMVNALYDIKTNTKLTPFVGAGLGILNGELDVRGDTADDTEFGYQIIAGATYNINNNIAIDLSYRFQQAPSDFSKNGVNIEYMSSLIMAGIRYNF